MSSRWGWFILFLCMIVLAIIVAFAFSEDISVELHISDLIKNGVYTDGVLVQELQGSPGATHFRGEYEAGSLKYEFILSDEGNILRLNDTVTIIYDRKKPRDYIIENRYRNRGLPFGLIILLFIIFIGLWSLYDFIKIGHLEDNGKRVLSKPIKYKWHWWAHGGVYTVVCKIPGDDSKIYKGVCRIRFKEMMEEENNNLKYIPIYISRNHKNLYYVHCEEVTKIVKHKSYNGHTINELQRL